MLSSELNLLMGSVYRFLEIASAYVSPTTPGSGLLIWDHAVSNIEVRPLQSEDQYYISDNCAVQ